MQMVDHRICEVAPAPHPEDAVRGVGCGSFSFGLPHYTTQNRFLVGMEIINAVRDGDSPSVRRWLDENLDMAANQLISLGVSAAHWAASLPTPEVRHGCLVFGSFRGLAVSSYIRF